MDKIIFDLLATILIGGPAVVVLLLGVILVLWADRRRILRTIARREQRLSDLTEMAYQDMRRMNNAVDSLRTQLRTLSALAGRVS